MSADPALLDNGATVPPCPLCMRPFLIEDAASGQRPSAEHILQLSLGGTLEFATLTCGECNNRHGQELQGHLTKAMKALDFMEGKGAMPIVIENDIGHVAANLDWNLADPVTIKIVGDKASKVEAVEGIPEMLRSTSKLTFKLRFGFVPLSYWRAILRVGYLAAFREFGYAYGFSKEAAQVREILDGGVVPEGIFLEAYPDSDPPLPLLVQQVRELSAILVLFRPNSLTTRWLAVLLPGRTGCGWSVLEKAVANPELLRARYTFEKFASSVTFRFKCDPIARLRNLSFPSIPSANSA